MKYIKSFGQVNEGSESMDKYTKKTKQIANQAITLESILQSFFALFIDVNAIKQIWSARKEEKKLMELSIDIYNHLVDVGDIIDLPQTQQIKYAENLGIEIKEDTNILSEIAKQLYIEHYKRDLDEDLEETIKYLEKESNFDAFKEVQKMFLEKIKEIKKVL